MQNIKKEGKHSLVYGCFDDMNMVGRIILYFDDYDEIEKLVTLMLDCGTYKHYMHDCDSVCKPIKDSVDRLKDANYVEMVKEVMKRNSQYDLYDASGDFFCTNYSSSLPTYVSIDRIVDDLKCKMFSCFNRVNRYYVHAFAIDFVRFDIHSKMAAAQLIDWGSSDQLSQSGDKVAIKPGPVVMVLVSNDYDSNYYYEKLLL